MSNSPNFFSNILVTVGEVVLLMTLFFIVIKTINFIFNQLRTNPRLSTYYATVDKAQNRIKGWLLVLFVGLGLALVGFNIYLMFQQADVLAETLKIIASTVPPNLWRELGLAFLQISGLIIIARMVMVVVNRLLPELQSRTKSFEQIKVNDESIDVFFSMLHAILKNGIRLLALALAGWLLPLPGIFVETLFTVLKIYLIIALGRLIVKMVAMIVDTLDALSQKYLKAVNLQEFYQQLRGLIPLLSRTLEYIIFVQAASLAIAQITPVAEFSRYGATITQLISIAFFSRVVVEIFNLIVDRTLLTQGDLSESVWKQRLTFAPLAKSLLRYATYFGAFLLMLSTLGYNIAPILAALGGLGLIVGLAAQPVLNDLVSGLFILFENLYLVGDYIETSQARGVVEAIDIRTTHIRDPDGQLHLIRNGQVGDIINFSKGYIYAVVLVGVTYEARLDHVFSAIRQVGQTLNESYSYALAPTEIQGVEEFGDFGMTIRTLTKAKPGYHLEVGRELRKLIKEAFDQEGINFAVENEKIHIALPIDDLSSVPAITQN